MKQTRNNNSNNRIINFVMILGLSILLLSGCQQINDAVNSNKSTNTNTATTANANSNANTAQTLKNDLLGTWIAVDDPKKKVIFTADVMTAVEDGKENKLKYTRLSNDEIEVVFDGNKRKVKTTFEGEVLTMTADETVKFKRESANSNANANTSSVVPSNTATAPKEEVPLTEDAKVFKKNLVGKWKVESSQFTFTENKFYIDEDETNAQTYRVVDENTIEIKVSASDLRKVRITLEDDGNTLVWQNGNKFTRVK